jgi:hypothetical protein
LHSIPDAAEDEVELDEHTRKGQDAAQCNRNPLLRPERGWWDLARDLIGPNRLQVDKREFM